MSNRLDTCPFRITYSPGIILVGIIISLIRDTVIASVEERIRRRAEQLDEVVEYRRRGLGWMRAFEKEKNEVDSERPERPLEDKKVKQAEEKEISYEDSLRKAIRHNQDSSYRREVRTSSMRVDSY